MKKSKELRLDLGTGKGLTCPKGFVGVDITPWKGVTTVDLREPWPWEDSSVDAAQAVHLLQYLTPPERVHFVNELYRVLKPSAKMVIVTPHWCSARAYGDVFSIAPPVSETWFAFLNKAWRDGQNFVDHSGYTCDFDHTLGYGMHPEIVPRNPLYQQNALQFWKEAAQDIHATLTSNKKD